jgi:hypothetical protein
MKKLPIHRCVGGSHRYPNSFVVVAYALLDDEDYDRAIQYHWGLKQKYVSRCVDDADGKTVSIHLHNVVAVWMGLVLRPSETIDHFPDRNPLNCQRNNLRAATKSMQLINQGLAKNSTSGEKGVSWDKKSQKWHAQIAFEGKKINLGYFTGKQEAICVRKRAEIERDQVIAVNK